MSNQATSRPASEPATDHRRPSKRFYEPIARLPKVVSWPEVDRGAWEQACFLGGPLDPSGGLAHLGPESLDQLRRGYARWVTFLALEGQLLDGETPAERPKFDRVGRFYISLRGRMSPLSARHCLYQFAKAMEAMAPGHDWQWLRTHPLRPTSQEVERGRKRIVPPDPAELLAGALELCDAVDRLPASVPNAIRFRDGAIVAFATYLAPRRKNIAEITIGQHLVLEVDQAKLLLDEIKNREIIDSRIPPKLQIYLDRYIAHHRLILLGDRPDNGALWISRFGRPLAYGSLFLVFQRTGERAIGRPINVHSVRYAMATTTLDNNIHDIDIASAGLAHIGTSCVARVYDKGGPPRAQRVWRKLLRRHGFTLG